MNKDIITAPALDSLMADILPMTPTEVKPVNIGPQPSATATDVQPQRRMPRPESADAGEALAHLYNITEAERTLFTTRRRFNLDLSNDIAFILRTVSSHQLPQGLVVSAILRHYITHHLEDIRILLSQGPPTEHTDFQTENVSAPGQPGGEDPQCITPSGDAYFPNQAE